MTGVLEEMSVTCERPLDGASAAQKLNSHSFDLVLVDCENLPAAKLIFDVCRRGKNGNNPVPIAIVDGRAGLPTAFRLGAELILTKPVAKDQARSTIRTAVSRMSNDVPASESYARTVCESGPAERRHDYARRRHAQCREGRTRAGSHRLFATDKLCGSRSSRGSHRCSNRGSNRCPNRDSLRAGQHAEDAFRRGRNRYRANRSKVGSAVHTFFGALAIFTKVLVGSSGGGRFKTRAPGKTF